MPDWVKTYWREIRPNFVYDLTKYSLVFGFVACSGVVYLFRGWYLNLFLLDRFLVPAVVGLSLICLGQYLLRKRGVKQDLIPTTAPPKVAPTPTKIATFPQAEMKDAVEVTVDITTVEADMLALKWQQLDEQNSIPGLTVYLQNVDAHPFGKCELILLNLDTFHDIKRVFRTTSSFAPITLSKAALLESDACLGPHWLARIRRIEH